MECLIVGRPNVGKTLLLITFAAHCGVEHLQLQIQPVGGAPVVQTFSLAEARARLVSPSPHHTQHVQAVELMLPRGKGRRRFRLIDTTGLTDDIHEHADLRRAVAQTLQQLRSAAVILHVLDAAAIGRQGPDRNLPEIDRQVARYASLRHAYLIVANKMDLPWAKQGYELIRKQFAQQRVLPVSALTGAGMKDVKAFVWDHL